MLYSQLNIGKALLDIYDGFEDYFGHDFKENFEQVNIVGIILGCIFGVIFLTVIVFIIIGVVKSIKKSKIITDDFTEKVKEKLKEKTEPSKDICPYCGTIFGENENRCSGCGAKRQIKNK